MIGRFLTRLDLYELDGHAGAWYCLLADLVYAEDAVRYTAPAGTLTDFASVPRMFWSIVSPIGRHTKAAVLHDYYCQTRLIDSVAVHALFRRALQACGCTRSTIALMWSMVRVFGPRFTARAVMP